MLQLIFKINKINKNKVLINIMLIDYFILDECALKRAGSHFIRLK